MFVIEVSYRYTPLSKRELTAEVARSIKSTRCLSTRRVRTLSSLKEREDMMPSKRDSEVKPSPSSERRQRTLRRSLSNLNVVPAREEECPQSRDARPSFLERKKLPRVVPSIEHSW